MHYHLEIVMPPTDDVESQVANILAPFNEQADEDEHDTRHAFWDFWVIGGRWAGVKLQTNVGEERITAFREELVRREVTVSGFTAGKQTLKPSDQISMVDALWREWFPSSGIDVCPLFSHSNNQYKSDSNLPGDVCRVSELPKDLTCGHVIIAKHGFKDPGMFEAAGMLRTSIWNGVTHQPAAFDGKVSSALDWYRARCQETYSATYADQNGVKPDWLCVTVDYHS